MKLLKAVYLAAALMLREFLIIAAAPEAMVLDAL